MHPLAILAIAVSLVLIGILAFRLHAFLVLTLAALVVALLTPREAVEQYLLEKKAFEIRSNDAGDSYLLSTGQSILPGTRLAVVRPGTPESGLAKVADLTVLAVEPDSPTPVQVDSGSIPDAGWLPNDLVVRPEDFRLAQNEAGRTVGERVAAAFGNTCGKIGILIALAAIIGKCLLDSGAADRIVRSALRWVGESGAPLAFVCSGFLLGIPVFFDTVFYLMMPLGKAMRMRTGRNYLLYILTIVAGASMAHSLVPPTPGPLLVAEELGIDLGLMILAGCAVGFCSSSAAYCYAAFVNRRSEVPLRESADFSLENLKELTDREDSELPSLFFSALPILLPVVLIAGNTVLQQVDESVLPGDGILRQVAATLGNKNIALGVATAIAMGMLVVQTRTRLRDLAESFQSALASGGVIILITAAGGAFGAMLQQTGVVGLIRSLPQYSPLVILTLAFLVTAAIRTAQGSGTVAMITAVGILAGFASEGQLGCHQVYLGLAIGCGSKPIAWMNDSGFWVICRMSGMTEAEGLRFVTPMSILMGLAGLLATLVGAAVFPMV
jgi:GntP family gluconate:H+ symporter